MKILKIVDPFVKLLFKSSKPGVVLQAFQPPFQLHCNIKVQTVTITLPWQNVTCPSEINMLAQCVALGQHAFVIPRGDNSLYS